MECPGRRCGAPGRRVVCHQKFFEKLFQKGLTIKDFFDILYTYQMRKGVVKNGNKKNFKRRN